MTNIQKTDTQTIFQKDDTLEVTIEDIGQDGEGIGHVGGYTLFVKDAVIGDTVTAKIMKAKKNYAFARLLEVTKPSPFRVAPRCEIARQCGGCQIQALRYDKQLEFKQNKVRNDLIRIGGFPQEEVTKVLHPIVGMEDPFRYRNKAQMPVGHRDEEPIAGFYAARTHVIVPVSECYIGAEENRKIVAAILAWMRTYRVPSYDEATGEGLIRHILIRSGIYSGQIMVCIVANGEKLPHEQELVEMLSVLPGMTSISISTNTQKTNVIMGRKIRTLWGTDTIEDSLHVFNVEYVNKNESALSETMDNGETARFIPSGLDAVRFNISPLSFYQVNPKQTEKLYSIVLHYANLSGKETVWDLYCGVGTISLFLARFAKEVYGVEVVPEAIRDAKKNAERNGITNTLFQVGKVEEVLPDYVRRKAEAQSHNNAPVDVVVVDPPRKGCDEKCLQTILEVKPRRMIYVSCDPATLSRDLKILVAGGYRIRDVQPLDQFGHNIHVETVCLMSRVEGK